MELALAPLRKYADFQGRARRAEYWLFTLLQIVVMIVLMIVGHLAAGGDLENSIAVFPYAIGALVFFIPGIAVSVRRLHDTNRSGWWIFISLVPIIGGIWFLVLTVLDGTAGPNRFGPDPKGRGASDTGLVSS